MAERQILRDAIGIGGIHPGGATETAPALGILGLGQVASARAGAHDFSGGRDFKSFGHGLFRFDAFGSSHKIFKSLLQKSADYMRPKAPRQAIFNPKLAAVACHRPGAHLFSLQ